LCLTTNRKEAFSYNSLSYNILHYLQPYTLMEFSRGNDGFQKIHLTRCQANIDWLKSAKTVKFWFRCVFALTRKIKNCSFADFGIVIAKAYRRHSKSCASTFKDNTFFGKSKFWGKNILKPPRRTKGYRKNGGYAHPSQDSPKRTKLA
jgi:hypothetical protein